MRLGVKLPNRAETDGAETDGARSGEEKEQGGDVFTSLCARAAESVIMNMWVLHLIRLDGLISEATQLEKLTTPSLIG